MSEPPAKKIKHTDACIAVVIDHPDDYAPQEAEVRALAFANWELASRHQDRYLLERLIDKLGGIRPPKEGEEPKGILGELGLEKVQKYLRYSTEDGKWTIIQDEDWDLEGDYEDIHEKVARGNYRRVTWTYVIEGHPQIHDSENPP